MIFFWLIVRWGSEYRQANHWRFLQPKWWVVAGFAIGVTATLHTYLAARVLWLLFPVSLLYLALFHRASFREIWRPTLAGLAGAGLMVIPMFAYIQAHPEAETRLQSARSASRRTAPSNRMEHGES